VAESLTFDIREVTKGLYAVDGVFRAEVDYFAPSPLYLKRRQDKTGKLVRAEEQDPGSQKGSESANSPNDR
jgi:hypothetical protein